MKTDEKEKIPVTKVLDDMYDPNGGLVSWAARDYYYENYATDYERKIMDREDKFETTIAIIFWIILLSGIVICVLTSSIGKEKNHENNKK